MLDKKTPNKVIMFISSNEISSITNKIGSTDFEQKIKDEAWFNPSTGLFDENSVSFSK